MVVFKQFETNLQVFFFLLRLILETLKDDVVNFIVFILFKKLQSIL